MHTSNHSRMNLKSINCPPHNHKKKDLSQFSESESEDSKQGFVINQSYVRKSKVGALESQVFARPENKPKVVRKESEPTSLENLLRLKKQIEYKEQSEKRSSHQFNNSMSSDKMHSGIKLDHSI